MPGKQDTNMDKEKNVQRFLDLIQKARRGKFKLYIGMVAGVGKTYRMLQETRSLLNNGIDVKIAYIDTHRRAEAEALLPGLPVIPRKMVYYKGKELEEMDLQAVLNIKPEVVIVDELAHTNIPGSKHEKRWQDVIELLDAGINVISAVNIQHIESLYSDIEKITGIGVQERIPDFILEVADEIVNIDLTADELIERLKAGKIYEKNKIEMALQNFFKAEKILQLRELALKEVAGQVERMIETEVFSGEKRKPEKFLACVSTNSNNSKKIIRKTARIANYYTAKWYVLYVQMPHESAQLINVTVQRDLLKSFELAAELGAEVVTVKSRNIANTISEFAFEKQVTSIIIGRPSINLATYLFKSPLIYKIIKKISDSNIDLLVIS
jgi:two-component system, OmpR family, sensor histidine kinase KdpD